jgi:hypothetical protein
MVRYQVLILWYTYIHTTRCALQHLCSNRKATKFQRAIVGASLDEIKAKRASVTKKSPAQLAALKEIKARKVKAPKAKSEGVKEKPAASKSQAGPK